MIEAYTQKLRRRGYRMTPQRLAMLQVLLDHPGHLTPLEVFHRAQNRLPGLTEPTVYRTLEFLAQNGMVHPSLTSSGHLVYEIAGREHHHVICRSCGANVEIEGALLQRLYKQLEASSGYKLTTSHLTFFGLCPACQKKAK
jgi:Fe2+ or Zn2+ uptake regulation protein